ncbi:MAG: SpoIID/LytB domain-containing protein [Candidatus Riflebacteria bacterium]
MKKRARQLNFLRNVVKLAIIMAIFIAAAVSAAPGKLRESEPILRVKIGGRHQKISITLPGDGEILNHKGRKIRTIKGKSNFTWTIGSGKRKKRVEHLNETLIFAGRKNQVTLNGKTYHGRMQVKFTGTGAIAVNHVGIEDYLRGVVGSEMGSLSPAESLKAQTVIARTYAYSNRGKHGSEGADVCDSTHCQVYQGISAERESINKAVDGTRGIIMISEGKPIQTLYHATCGGMTSDNDKVFGGAACSYLRRVKCPFCKDGAHFRWVKTLNINEFKSAMGKENIHFNHLLDFGYEAPGLMDRVDKVFLVTDKGEFSIKGTTFRRLFDLKSTTFTLGNRKNVKAIISAATQIDPEYETKSTNLQLVLTGLGDTATDGPAQLIIQTAKGLKRVARPEEGWQTVVCRQIPKNAPAESVPLSRNEMTRSGVGGRIEKIEIFGRGYGHQVGLCQSGAIELGKRNWSYRQILPFYYANVALRRLDY